MNDPYTYVTVWCFWDTRPWSLLKHRVIFVVPPSAYGKRNSENISACEIIFFNSLTLRSINLSLNMSPLLSFLHTASCGESGCFKSVWCVSVQFYSCSKLKSSYLHYFFFLSFSLGGIPVIPSGLERRGTQKLAPCLNPFSMQHILLDLIGWLQYFCSAVWPSTAENV